MPYPTPTTPIQTIGLREVCQIDGHHFRRLRGTDKWIEYSPALASKDTDVNNPVTDASTAGPESKEMKLSLIQFTQLPQEPLHWALFLGIEGCPGELFQVTGDAECMHYEHVEFGSGAGLESGVDVTTLEGFLTAYTLASFPMPSQKDDGNEAVKAVKEIVWNEPAPRAASRKDVKENCQGWAVRVLQRLMERGLVEERKVSMVKGLMRPV